MIFRPYVILRSLK